MIHNRFNYIVALPFQIIGGKYIYLLIYFISFYHHNRNNFNKSISGFGDAHPVYYGFHRQGRSSNEETPKWNPYLNLMYAQTVFLKYSNKSDHLNIQKSCRKTIGRSYHEFQVVFLQYLLLYVSCSMYLFVEILISNWFSMQGRGSMIITGEPQDDTDIYL